MMLVLADIMTPFSKLTVQVYSPESADSTEVMLLDDVYNVKDFISGLTGGTTTVPSGPSLPEIGGHFKFTFAKTVN